MSTLQHNSKTNISPSLKQIVHKHILSLHRHEKIHPPWQPWLTHQQFDPSFNKFKHNFIFINDSVSKNSTSKNFLIILGFFTTCNLTNGGDISRGSNENQWNYHWSRIYRIPLVLNVSPLSPNKKNILHNQHRPERQRLSLFYLLAFLNLHSCYKKSTCPGYFQPYFLAL